MVKGQNEAAAWGLFESTLSSCNYELIFQRLGFVQLPKRKKWQSLANEKITTKGFYFSGFSLFITKIQWFYKFGISLLKSFYLKVKNKDNLLANFATTPILSSLYRISRMGGGVPGAMGDVLFTLEKAKFSRFSNSKIFKKG